MDRGRSLSLEGQQTSGMNGSRNEGGLSTGEGASSDGEINLKNMFPSFKT